MFLEIIKAILMGIVEAVSYTHLDVYKRQGEDLYLIGTSEHTMIGRFIDQTLDEATLPLTLRCV